MVVSANSRANWPDRLNAYRLEVRAYSKTLALLHHQRARNFRTSPILVVTPLWSK